MNPVAVHMALKDKSKAQIFTYSKEWTAPLPLLNLSVRPLAFLNVSFLVADSELAENDTPKGQPVLKQFGIDLKMMLENNCAQLNERDCWGAVGNDIASSTVGRTLISRIKKVKSNVVNNEIDERDNTKTSPDRTPQRPRPDYYFDKAFVSPAPSPFLIDLPNQN